MKVLKFGTSAIATPQKMGQVADLISKNPHSIVIVSAIHGTTQRLQEISDYLYKKNPEGANEIINLLEGEYLSKLPETFKTDKKKDEAIRFVKEKIAYIRTFTKDLFTLFEEKMVLAQGEMLSSGLLTLVMQERDVATTEIQAFDFMRIDRKGEPDTTFIQNTLNQILQKNPENIHITQGYICQNAYGEIDNFQFGGSDYAAALIGAAILAQEIQIWTGFDVKTTGKSQLIFNNASVRHISFDEAAELAYFGAKILHPMCILPAKMANIPVRLLNMLTPDSQGILISNETEQGKIKAIAAKNDITVINIKSSKMLLAHGFLRKICEIFEKHQTAIDMLTTSEVGISITIDNLKYLTEIADDLKKQGIVNIDKNMTIIAVVGDLDYGTNPTLSSVLETIKKLPLRMISYGGSRSNISFVVKEKDKDDALNLLSKTIF